mgnify:CR=1 FL=1
MPSEEMDFWSTPFRVLVEKADALAEARSRHASKPAEERRMAAEFEYGAGVANYVVSKAMGDDCLPRDRWPRCVLALAIDPDYAPAILTVGSLEYQLGREEEAMRLFLILPEISWEEDDLAEIIGKAVDFLIDEGDMERAGELSSKACRRHPGVARYHADLGYCLGKMGRKEKAVEQARRALDCEPENHALMSDLGWSLVEAGRHEEAEDVLEGAVEAAPDGYELAENNLDEVRRRMRESDTQ